MNYDNFLKLLFCSKCKRDVYAKHIHTHQGWSLFYNISGQVHVVLMENGKEKLLDLQPSEFVFFSSKIPHRLYITESDNSYLVHLMLHPCSEAEATLSLQHLSAISPDAVQMLKNPQFFTQAMDLNNMLLNTLTEIMLRYDFCRKTKGLSALSGLLLQTMLAEIAYLCNQHAEPRFDRYVNQAITYLKGHFTENVRVADVAAAVGVHPVYLQRIFKERTGMSMIDYLIGYRVKKACRLLVSTTFPIIEIGMECGFSNRQHFSRCFRERLGLNPSEYRNQNRIVASDNGPRDADEAVPGDCTDCSQSLRPFRALTKSCDLFHFVKEEC